MSKTSRATDIYKNTWLVRNPIRQSEWIEIPAWSIPIDKFGLVEWEDALGRASENR